MIEADITNWLSLRAAREEVSKITVGALDYLISNPAYIETNTAGTALEDFDDAIEQLKTELFQSFETNAVGVTKTINLFLPSSER